MCVLLVHPSNHPRIDSVDTHALYFADKLHTIGYDSADPGVVPTLDLRNVTVQAFINGKISESKRQ